MIDHQNGGILVVEDSALRAEILRRKLVDQGYQTAVAEKDARTMAMIRRSLETTCDRAKELLRLVRDLHLEHQGQSLGGITVSMGVAVYPQHGEEPEALLQTADKALYQAKSAGRDRVVVAECGG
jgi:diguanylate cyclase (GGDEF)-like protein